MKYNEIKGDAGLVIAVPTEGKRKTNLKNQYLWFGNEDGRCVGHLGHKGKLKKLRRWIDEILGDRD